MQRCGSAGNELPWPRWNTGMGHLKSNSQWWPGVGPEWDSYPIHLTGGALSPSLCIFQTSWFCELRIWVSLGSVTHLFLDKEHDNPGPLVLSVLARMFWVERTLGSEPALSDWPATTINYPFQNWSPSLLASLLEGSVSQGLAIPACCPCPSGLT